MIVPLPGLVNRNSL